MTTPVRSAAFEYSTAEARCGGASCPHPYHVKDNGPDSVRNGLALSAWPLRPGCLIEGSFPSMTNYSLCS